MIRLEAAETEAVEELKRRTLSDVTPKMLEDELLFYRFCKARDFNVSQAESMLRKHIAWRKEFEMDSILSLYKPSEVLTRYAPTSFVCFSRDGTILRYVDCGGADLKGLLRSSLKTEFMKYFMFHVEADARRVIDHHSKKGHPLLMFMPIFDFQDLSYANATSIKGLQWLIFIMKSYMDNYPERLQHAMFINVPSYFTWLYAVVKKIFPPTVKQKIRLYGADGWKQDLLDMVDPDHLPAFLGGTRTDPDGNPLCKTFIMRGEPVPERYYLGQERVQLDDSEKLTVLPFSKVEVRLEVDEPNSHIEFEFEVKGGDISYSVLFRERSLEERLKVELVPKRRTDTCHEPEKGVLKCEKAGTYTLEFDNTHSWIHSKQVHHRTRVRTPGEVEADVVASSGSNTC